MQAPPLKWLRPVLEKIRRNLLFPLSNQIVHFHDLLSTWCTAVPPFTGIRRFSGTQVELKMNSTPVFRSAASGAKGPRAVHTMRVQPTIAYT